MVRRSIQEMREIINRDDERARERQSQGLRAHMDEDANMNQGTTVKAKQPLRKHSPDRKSNKKKVDSKKTKHLEQAKVKKGSADPIKTSKIMRAGDRLEDETPGVRGKEGYLKRAKR